jgi:hypothetical protein
MYQGTNTRKPRRLIREGQTSTYRRRKPTLLAKLAFTTWAIMAGVLEALTVLAVLVAITLACLIVPLVIWF